MLHTVIERIKRKCEINLQTLKHEPKVGGCHSNSFYIWRLLTFIDCLSTYIQKKYF